MAEVARDHGLALLQPDGVGSRGLRDWIQSHEPDVLVVAAFGRILGPKLLGLAPMGALNVHASLLPRWRGASPIQAAILAGDPETGISIMQMTRGLDEGPVLHSLRTPIDESDTAETLVGRLADLGVQALVETLDGIADGGLDGTAQPGEGVTYAPLLRKEDGRLDWSASAAKVHRMMRALYPWPGTTAVHAEKSVALKLLPPVEILDGHSDAAPGTVIAAGSSGVDVACGDGGIVRVSRLQAPGRQALDGSDFLRGYDLGPGSVLS